MLKSGNSEAAKTRILSIRNRETRMGQRHFRNLTLTGTLAPADVDLGAAAFLTSLRLLFFCVRSIATLVGLTRASVRTEVPIYSFPTDLGSECLSRRVN